MTAVWDISEYRLIDDISITGYIIRRIISEHFSTEISASIFSIYFVSTKRVFFVVGKPDGRRRSSPDRQLPLHRGDHQHPSMAVVDGELCSARQVPGIWCGRRCVLLTSNIVHKFFSKIFKNDTLWDFELTKDNLWLWWVQDLLYFLFFKVFFLHFNVFRSVHLKYQT